jgi:hypothetical protein
MHLLLAACTALHCGTVDIDVRPIDSFSCSYAIEASASLAVDLRRRERVYDVRLRGFEFYVAYSSP